MPHGVPIVPLEPGEVVINPVTQLPEEDETMKLAIKNGFVYITKRGKPIIQWSRMRTAYRNDYTSIPENFGFTDQQAQIMMKAAHEKFVPVAWIAKLFGKKYEWGIKFIQAKKIPVFKEPIQPFSYYCFSGDVVRALETCMLDFEKDGQFWPRYILHEHEMERRHSIKKRKQKENEARPDTTQTPGRAGDEGTPRPADVLEAAKGEPPSKEEVPAGG